MKQLCKLFIALCVLLMCSMTASAEKTDWSDNTYNFNGVQRVMVYNVKFTDTRELPNNLITEVLNQDYLKTASRSQYQMVRPDSGAADIYVTAELLKWHDDYYIKPAYTSWETKEITSVRRHRDGSKTRETRKIHVPVEHPPERVNTSTVRMRFDVYDVKTGKRVMARDEIRVRDYSTRGQKGIFGRISKSFFDELVKKIKK